jgi:hypothetical protein
VKRKCWSIVIILLLVGIAVAPSINPGIVQASNDQGTIRNRITSQPMSISLKRVSDILKRADSLKHPFLYLVVFIISASRLIRGIFIIWIFLNIIELPLLFLRGYWLVSTSKHWAKFWNDIADSLGWNWPSLSL